MSIHLTTVDQLQTYLLRLVVRAEHHAEEVSEVVLVLAGVIVMFHDRGTLEVHPYRGEMANALHVSIGGRQYAFSYDHADQTIVMRRDSFRGEVVTRFDNSVSASQVHRLFRGLATPIAA